MPYLKEDTAVEIKIGPFVDQTDGFTPETGLTISQADVRLAKNGGDWAQKNESTTLVHEENGWYRCLLDATDTNTSGLLYVAINESGALPVWMVFDVLASTAYDAIVAASGTGVIANVWAWRDGAIPVQTVAGVPEVDVTHWIGTAAATPTVAGVPEVDITHIIGSVINAGMHRYFNTAMKTGTADSGTTTTMVDAELTQTDTDYFKDQILVMTSGTLAWQARRITAFDPTTDTVTVSPAFTQAVTTQNYIIIPFGMVDLAAINGVAQTTTLDTIKTETASIQSDTDNLQTRVPAALVGGRMDSSVGAMAANTLTASALAADAVTEIRALASGTIDAATNVLIEDAALTQADTDYWKGDIFLVTSGPAIGQARMITAFDPANDRLTISPNLTATPNTGDTYEILPGNNPWSEDATGNQTAGSFGQTLGDSAGGSSVFTKIGDVETQITGVQSDTDNIQTRLPAALVGGRMDSSVGAMAANTITAAATAADYLAEINAEMVDTLNVDTYAEPGQGTPAATASLAAKIGYLFKNWRNRKTETATQWSLYNDDAVTIDQKSTVADDGTTGSKTEITTGP